MADKNVVSICSLNTHGLKSNTEYIHGLLNKFDIIFISEHWLSKAEESILKTQKSHQLILTPAEKAPAGRPFGGNCFLVSHQLQAKVEVMHEDANILSIRLTSNSFKIIFIGVYLTCYHDQSSLEKYSEQLNTLSGLIETHIDECEVVLLGDFQSFPSTLYDHMQRQNSHRNPLSPLLMNFITENNLELYDITAGVGPNYTYQHKTLKNQSYIDHIALLKETSLEVQNCMTHELESNNMSDHQPISTTLFVETTPSLASILKEELKYVPRSAWKNMDFIN